MYQVILTLRLRKPFWWETAFRLIVIAAWIGVPINPRDAGRWLAARLIIEVA